MGKDKASDLATAQPEMKSVNDTFDAVSKVTLLEHQTSSPSPTPTQRRNRNLIKFFFCSVIFLALITGAVLLYLIHENHLNSQYLFNSKANRQAVGIFCSLTSHQPECIASLSSFIPKNGRNKINPDDIFSYSHMLASSEMNGLASLTKSLILISTESRSAVPALQRCAGSIDDSLHKLNRSFAASVGFELFSASVSGNTSVNISDKIRDMKQWVNGSVSDLRSCSDILVTLKDDDDSRSKAVGELKRRVEVAMIYARNNLDFLQYRYGIMNGIESWNEYQNSEPAVDCGYLSIILFMFCPQYLVLVMLYFLLLRKY